jgi:hypothetical protein
MQFYQLGLIRGTFQVAVIAVFTKYDQFKRDIKMKLEDENRETDLDAEVEKIFDRHYLANMYCTNLCRLGMHKPGQRCTDLIEMTANALSGKIVAARVVNRNVRRTRAGV